MRIDRQKLSGPVVERVRSVIDERDGIRRLDNDVGHDDFHSFDTSSGADSRLSGYQGCLAASLSGSEARSPSRAEDEAAGYTCRPAREAVRADIIRSTAVTPRRYSWHHSSSTQ